MKWTEHNPNSVSTLMSPSTQIDAIITDIEFILNDTKDKLKNFQNDAIAEILIYIDGTNGNIFCCEFNSKTEEAYDDKGSYMVLSELWETCCESDGGAMEFDFTIKEAMSKLMQTDFGQNLSKDFNIFIQDELDPAERI